MRETGFGLSAMAVGLILRLRLSGFLCWQASVAEGGGVDVREHAAKRSGLLPAWRLTLRLSGRTAASSQSIPISTTQLAKRCVPRVAPRQDWSRRPIGCSTL